MREDPAELQAILALRDSIEGLRFDVRDERKGRRLSIILVCVAILTGVLYYHNDARQACATRTAGRADVRAAIGAAVDQGAEYGKLSREERLALRAQVDAAVLLQLPPPDC